jgi:hypothetical protein
VRVFWAVAAAQGLYEPYDLAALFKSGRHQRQIYKMGEQRAACDEEVSAGNKDAVCPCGECSKELPQPLKIGFRENGKARDRASPATVERWRNPPNAATSDP